MSTARPASFWPRNGEFFDLLEMPSAVERERPLGIDHRDVGDRADGERAAGQAERARRAAGERRDRALVVERAHADEVEHDRQRGLEAEHAGRRALELDVLLDGRVRRVVGRDRVDRAVGERLEQRLLIGGRAQRRHHLGARVVVRCTPRR